MLAVRRGSLETASPFFLGQRMTLNNRGTTLSKYPRRGPGPKFRQFNGATDLDAGLCRDDTHKMQQCMQKREVREMVSEPTFCRIFCRV